MKIKVKEGERKRCLYQLVEYKACKNKSSSIKIGTAQNTFPPISYKLKNLTTWFIWSIWSGRSPKILFNNGRLVPDKNDGRNHKNNNLKIKLKQW